MCKWCCSKIRDPRFAKVSLFLPWKTRQHLCWDGEAVPIRSKVGISIEHGDTRRVPLPSGACMTQALGKNNCAARRALETPQKLAALPWLQRHMIWVHRKVCLMAANDEMRGSIFLADIGEFKNDPHHPGMDAPILDTIPEK